MHLGEKIIYYRNKLNITTHKLALIIGISPGYLSDIEKGVKIPSIEMLEKICTSLNISLKDIFDDELKAEPLTTELKTLVEAAKRLPPDKIEQLAKFLDNIKTI